MYRLTEKKERARERTAPGKDVGTASFINISSNVFQIITSFQPNLFSFHSKIKTITFEAFPSVIYHTYVYSKPSIFTHR